MRVRSMVETQDVYHRVELIDGDMWEGDYVLNGVGFWFVQTYLLTGRYSETWQRNYMYGVSSHW